jgi:hypothetical protein
MLNRFLRAVLRGCLVFTIIQEYVNKRKRITYETRHCSGCATWQSMRRLNFLEHQSKQKGLLDFHVAQLEQ